MRNVPVAWARSALISPSCLGVPTCNTLQTLLCFATDESRKFPLFLLGYHASEAKRLFEDGRCSGGRPADAVLIAYARSNRGLFFARPRVTLDKLAHQNAYLLPEKQ